MCVRIYICMYKLVHIDNILVFVYECTTFSILFLFYTQSVVKKHLPVCCALLYEKVRVKESPLSDCCFHVEKHLE